MTLCEVSLHHRFAAENSTEVRLVVTAHHAVYTETGILHRDISYNNIMFYYDDPIEHGRPKGVLCDWDLAKKLEPPNHSVIMRDLLQSMIKSEDIAKYEVVEPVQEIQPVTVHRPSGVIANDGDATAHQEQRYRTGTGPFMALDILLYDHAPLHLYRHDLESFYWVLVWFAAVFEPAKNKVGILPEFQENDLRNIGYRKGQYLDDTSVRNLIRERGDAKKGPEVEPYDNLNLWVDSLYEDLVYPVYSKYKTFVATLCTKLMRAQAADEKAAKKSAKKTTATVDSMGDDEPFAGNQRKKTPSVKDVMVLILRTEIY